MAQDRFKFDLIVKRYKSVSLNMMREIAMSNKNYFLQTFKRQSWGTQKWPEVDRRTPGTKAYKYPKHKDLARRTRPILVRKGGLRRAVNSSIRMVTTNKVYFSVDLPYAEIQNDGGRARYAKIPRRRYMGENKETNRMNKEIISKYVNKAFKQ